MCDLTATASIKAPRQHAPCQRPSFSPSCSGGLKRPERGCVRCGHLMPVKATDTPQCIVVMRSPMGSGRCVLSVDFARNGLDVCVDCLKMVLTHNNALITSACHASVIV
jgi:hypothetical protein